MPVLIVGYPPKTCLMFCKSRNPCCTLYFLIKIYESHFVLICEDDIVYDGLACYYSNDHATSKGWHGIYIFIQKYITKKENYIYFFDL